MGGLLLILSAVLLVLFTALAYFSHSTLWGSISVCYRASALVFGGGHVVLPLLEAGLVQPGWIGPEEFLTGYGAAQAVPGPLFTFAAYLGATMMLSAGLPDRQSSACCPSGTDCGHKCMSNAH